MLIWILFDNSLNKGERVAFGGRQLPTKIKDIYNPQNEMFSHFGTKR